MNAQQCGALTALATLTRREQWGADHARLLAAVNASQERHSVATIVNAEEADAIAADLANDGYAVAFEGPDVVIGAAHYRWVRLRW